MRKIAIFLVTLAVLFLGFPGKASAAPSCDWSSAPNNRMRFCAGGLTTKEALLRQSFSFDCVGNCGTGVFGDVISRLGGSQKIRINDSMPIGQDNNGFFTCLEMDFSQDVERVVRGCMEPDILQKMRLSGCTGFSDAGDFAFLAAGGVVKIIFNDIPECWDAAQERTEYNKSLQECLPSFVGKLVGPGEGSTPLFEQTLCSEIMPTSLVLDGLQTFFNEDFAICNQIDATDLETSAKCQECMVDPDNPEGIWTAIGCIPVKPQAIVQTLIRLGLGLGGGITLLLILAGAFRLSISQGDPKQAEEAKEQITSAVIGLLFIIFSIVILRFIGVQVLQIPGFGGG